MPKLPEKNKTVRDLIHYGCSLNAENVVNLERDLKLNPDDRNLRVALLSYYRSHESHEHNVAWVKHALWFIANRPHDNAVPSIGIPTSCSDSQIQKLCTAVFSQAERFDDSPEVLLHGGLLLLPRLPTKAILLFERLLALDLTNREGMYFLLHAYVAAINQSPKSQHYINLACQLGERMLAEEDNYSVEFQICSLLCEVHNRAQQYDRAEDYGFEMLDIAKSINMWTDIAWAHLGVVALSRGDLKLAKSRLTRSSKFGVSDAGLFLASELLKLGEHALVVEYLRRTSSKSGRRKLFNQWIREISEGRTPHFRL